MKKFYTFSLLVIVSILTVTNSFYAEDVSSVTYNDQELANKLKNAPMDISLASGYKENGQSTVFTTLFDVDGTYRGYRINQIFKDQAPANHLQELKQSSAQVCSLSEINEFKTEYDGGKHQAFDIICMQSVGNENVASISDNKVSINPNYGKTEGYLVGVQVPNYTFEDLEGADVKGDILYIMDNNGGSATLVPLQTESDEKKDNSLLYIIIVADVILLILALGAGIMLYRTKKPVNMNVFI